MITKKRYSKAKRRLSRAKSKCDSAFDIMNIANGDLYANLNAFTNVTSDTEALAKLRAAARAIRKLADRLPVLYTLTEERRAAQAAYDKLLGKLKAQEDPQPQSTPEETSPSEEE